MKPHLAQVANYLHHSRPVLPDWLAEAAAALGVSALVYQRQCAPDSREPLCLCLRRQQERLRAITMLRQRELQRVSYALDARSIPVLALKGEATGRSLYREAHLRERRDTDLLVPPERFDDALRTLTELGFTPLPASQGRELGHAVDLRRVGGGGFVHQLDLHWRISSNPIFRRSLTFDALAAQAQAGVPARHHLFLLASMALIDSRDDRPRLTTVCDLDRLLARMDEADCAQVVDFCRQQQLNCVVRKAIAFTRSLLPGPLPEALRGLPDSDGEPARAWLSDDVWQRLWAELRYRPGAAARLAFVREHLFPPGEYLAARFHTQGRWRLALRGLERLVGGTAKRFGQRRGTPWI